MPGDQCRHLIGRGKVRLVDEQAELVVTIRQWRSRLSAQGRPPSRTNYRPVTVGVLPR